MSHFIYYHGPINIQGARNLETLLTKAASHDTPDITLCICSGGGDVSAGIGAYNFIKMLPVPVTTYAFGICGSIAATLFLAGQSRLSASANLFSLHAASYVDGPRKGEIAENTDLISLPFRQLLTWQDDRIAKYFGSAVEQFITPQLAMEMSMATEIRDIKVSSADEVVHVHVP